MTTTSKSDKLLDASQSVFLTHGYAGASVDDIARVAGVSKATLYSHFEDKRGLFTAMVARLCKSQAESLQRNTANLPTEKALVASGKSLSNFTAKPLAQGIFRICVAESERFPQIGRTFFETGPKVMSSQMMVLFEKAEAKGELVIENKQAAAVQFFLLCRGPYFYPMMFKLIDGVSQRERMQGLSEGLSTFNARFGSEAFRPRLQEEITKLT